MAHPTHLEIFHQGPEVWNQWRKENPEIHPDLSETSVYPEFARKDESTIRTKGSIASAGSEHPYNFSNTDFHNSSFESAIFPGADFSNCYLYEVDMSRAGFPGANFTNCMIRKAYCASTDFSGAQLVDCVLNNSTFIGANFDGAKIEGCNVYGVSAWDLHITENTVQKELFLHRDNFSRSMLGPHHEVVYVDDLALAQFFYFINQEDGFGKSLKKLNEKTVLLLGKFRDGGLDLLRFVGELLRERGFVPIIFDFVPNAETNLIENVTTMAGLSRYVFANLEGGSVPAELGRISSNFNTPIIAWIHDDKHDSVYAMFKDIISKNNVQYFTYLDQSDLPKQLDKVIDKAEKYLEELSKQNANADEKLDEGRISRDGK
jgi:hypothetical protein